MTEKKKGNYKRKVTPVIRDRVKDLRFQNPELSYRKIAKQILEEARVRISYESVRQILQGAYD